MEHMENRNDTFYFIAYVNNRKAVTVIDLAYVVDYERRDWDIVNEETFEDRDEAIFYARRLAEKYGLEYQLFESRYDESLNEYLVLTPDELGPYSKKR